MDKISEGHKRMIDKQLGDLRSQGYTDENVRGLVELVYRLGTMHGISIGHGDAALASKTRIQVLEGDIDYLLTGKRLEVVV